MLTGVDVSNRLSSFGIDAALLGVDAVAGLARQQPAIDGVPAGPGEFSAVENEDLRTALLRVFTNDQILARVVEDEDLRTTLLVIGLP